MENQSKTVWSVGATSKIAIEMQRIWASQGYSFILSSRKKTELSDIKKDLLVRGAPKVDTYSLEELTKEKPPLKMDILLIALGSLSDQKTWESSKEYRENQWATNTTLVMDWIEWGAKVIEDTGRGKICVMTSVAADRAKKSNYGYGAAKAALDFHLQGVAHRLAALGPRVFILKPGPTKTPMTAQLDQTKLADPKKVARSFTSAIKKDKTITYAPWIWKYIMLIIKLIPQKIWFKTSF